MENNGLNLIQLLAEIILTQTEMEYLLKNKKKYLVNFSQKGLMNLIIQKIRLALTN